MKTNPVVELVAAQLHREYRAAEQAMRRRDVGLLGSLLGIKNRLLHDHGFEHCGARKYFLKRAELLIKNSQIEWPQTLGETECTLSALRRLTQKGQ